MRILIVEDETAAYENLKDILSQTDPEIIIAGNTESVKQTIQWLKSNQMPDLIFMDIHLSDGSAFSIFSRISLEVPVIFTTAYDEYAIEAFRVNSIDYLLKPLKAEEVKRALQKFRKLAHHDIMEYLSQMKHLNSVQKYADRILIPVRDKLQPVDIKDIACFYSTEKKTSVYLKNGTSLPYFKSLEQIQASLDPTAFIRANKQYIIARSSVKSITIWFDSRLLINIETEPPERIFVSKNKAAEFKAWLTNGN